MLRRGPTATGIGTADGWPGVLVERRIPHVAAFATIGPAWMGPLVPLRASVAVGEAASAACLLSAVLTRLGAGTGTIAPPGVLAQKGV